MGQTLFPEGAWDNLNPSFGGLSWGTPHVRLFFDLFFFLRIVNATRIPPGPSLGPSWSHLGAILGRLGPILGHLGA